MTYTDFMIIKAIVLLIAVAIYGFYLGATGRK